MTLPGGKTALLLVAGAIGLLALGAVGGYGLRVQLERERHAEIVRERFRDPSVVPPYRNRVSHFAALPDGPTTVMLGDSLTAGAQWSELLATPVANRGIGGDTSGGLKARLAVSVPASARRVFLMIGVNDLTDERATPQVVAGNTAQIVEALKGRTVYVQSVLYTDEPALNQRIRALNGLNRTLCTKGGCTYVDVSRTIQAGDGMPGDLSYDGVHLNGAAYQRWADAIRPLILAGDGPTRKAVP